LPAELLPAPAFIGEFCFQLLAQLLLLLRLLQKTGHTQQSTFASTE